MQLTTKPATKKPATLAVQERLIAKATAFYANDKRGMSHSYDDVDYTDNKCLVWITCLVHNVRFLQNLNNHIKGSNGCDACPGPNGKYKKLTVERMIAECERVHGVGPYDYSRVRESNPKTVKSIFMVGCNACGKTFSTSVDNHVYHKTKCTHCAAVIRSKSNEKKRPLSERNLLLNHPDLARELHPMHDPSLISPGEGTIVTWICQAPAAHGLYKMRVASRVVGQNCPACANRVVHDGNRFSNNPDAISWWDYDLNTSEIDDCIENSRTHVHFVCDCVKDGVELKHKFVMYPNNFTFGERCPIKAGKRVAFDNSFATCVPNATLHWDDDKNGTVDAFEDVTYGSGRLFWFTCIDCKHSWQTSPNLSKLGIACPMCNPRAYGYSAKAINWLNSLEIEDMQHALRGGEHTIRGERWRADGYSPSTNTVYEFHGTYWHGDPRVYDPADMNTVCKKTYGELYARTKEREASIESKGYKLVPIWEIDYDILVSASRAKKDVPRLA